MRWRQRMVREHSYVEGTDAMPLEGEYESSTAQWVCEQVEVYESSGGTRCQKRQDP